MCCRRWAHTRSVAAAARAVSDAFGDADLLVAAAWLHAAGCAPALAGAGTGCHRLDGARYLCDDVRAGATLCCLDAHHSYAVVGAAEPGLAGELTTELPFPPGPLADALTCCVMTTGPDGQAMTITDRLAEHARLSR